MTMIRIHEKLVDPCFPSISELRQSNDDAAWCKPNRMRSRHHVIHKQRQLLFGIKFFVDKTPVWCDPPFWLSRYEPKKRGDIQKRIFIEK